VVVAAAGVAAVGGVGPGHVRGVYIGLAACRYSGIM
jgi:hypothetical protein